MNNTAATKFAIFTALVLGLALFLISFLSDLGTTGFIVACAIIPVVMGVVVARAILRDRRELKSRQAMWAFVRNR